MKSKRNLFILVGAVLVMLLSILIYQKYKGVFIIVDSDTEVSNEEDVNSYIINKSQEDTYYDTEVENNSGITEDIHENTSNTDEDKSVKVNLYNTYKVTEEIANEYVNLAKDSTLVSLKNVKSFKNYKDKYKKFLTNECLLDMADKYESAKPIEDLTKDYTETEDEERAEDSYPIYDKALSVVGYGTKEESEASYSDYEKLTNKIILDSINVADNKAIYNYISAAGDITRIITLTFNNEEVISKITETIE